MDHRRAIPRRSTIIKHSRAHHPVIRADALAPRSQPFGACRTVLPHWVTRSAPGRLDESETKETPRRTEIMLDEMTLESIPNASSLSLMRARARDLCATYTLLVRVRYPNDSNLFFSRSPERGGDDSTRYRFLAKYIVEKIQELSARKRTSWRIRSGRSGTNVRCSHETHESHTLGYCYGVGETQARWHRVWRAERQGASMLFRPGGCDVWGQPLQWSIVSWAIPSRCWAHRSSDSSGWLGSTKTNCEREASWSKNNAYARGDFELVVNPDKSIHLHGMVHRVVGRNWEFGTRELALGTELGRRILYAPLSSTNCKVRSQGNIKAYVFQLFYAELEDNAHRWYIYHCFYWMIWAELLSGRVNLCRKKTRRKQN